MTGLRLSGILGIVFWAAHAAESLWRGEPSNLLWACNVAALVVGVAQLLRWPRLNALGLMWLFFGIPLWLTDIVSGGELIWTSGLTHVGGWLVGLYGARLLGLPSGAWWKALVGIVALQRFCRLVTPPKDNVNLCWSVWPGWEKYFPSYFVYWLGLVTLSGLIFFAAERGLLRSREKAPA